MNGGRIAVVGGAGKTGRAVRSALESRGSRAVSIGRADWANLPGALRGCDAAYVIAPNMHPDEPAYVAQVLAVLALTFLAIPFGRRASRVAAR